MKQHMVDIAGRPAAESLAGLTGYVEAEPNQEVTGGLVVSVGLVNDGADEIALINPFALVQFQLRNDRGFPVKIPTRRPPMLVNSPGGEDWSLDGPVRVVGVAHNGQAADPSSVEGRVLRLAGREERVVSFAIERIVEDAGPAEGTNGQATSPEVTLPAGTYQVRGLATLIHAERANESRIVQSEEIEVRLGERAG